MTNSLLTGLRQADNFTLTENGALTNASTLSDVLDFFALSGGKRGQDITPLFRDAYREDNILATVAAFYMRDIRGGQGERDLFRSVLNWLYTNERDTFYKVFHLVPVYGRWDDLLTFVYDDQVANFVAMQLDQDVDSEHPSLLGKWMPSENASSPETTKLAKAWMTALEMKASSYRRMLTSLRKKIDIVERYMSSREFDKINYERVPSRASLIYRKSFGKRDTERYGAYLAAVQKGEKKINSAALFPYDLVKPYIVGGSADATIDAQWAALPDYTNGRKALAVVDTSGSMTLNGAMPMMIAVSLGIYFADRNVGPFKDHFITFSSNPQLQRITGKKLSEKVAQLKRADWGMSTNLQAVFELVLNTAVNGKVPATDMPEMIFIISDMEFNSCVEGRNFDAIKRKYAKAGYEMPMLVFWNVASRAKQVPVEQDEQGVMLVSGASPSVFKSALATKTVTPMDLMLEVLTGERYREVINALV